MRASYANTSADGYCNAHSIANHHLNPSSQSDADAGSVAHGNAHA